MLCASFLQRLLPLLSHHGDPRLPLSVSCPHNLKVPPSPCPATVCTAILCYRLKPAGGRGLSGLEAWLLGSKVKHSIGTSPQQRGRTALEPVPSRGAAWWLEHQLTSQRIRSGPSIHVAVPTHLTLTSAGHCVYVVHRLTGRQTPRHTKSGNSKSSDNKKQNNEQKCSFLRGEGSLGLGCHEAPQLCNLKM